MASDLLSYSVGSPQVVYIGTFCRQKAIQILMKLNRQKFGTGMESLPRRTVRWAPPSF